ncbi:molybdopterin-dependent oxidoreductase [Dictyobacter aurantiacus]|uniref:Formate dehydrogenase n=1 Tax=Dictyobacter aurantiacus TaxID=1936993 RepID=A0A401ZT80_9CHLR|nr:molybdopterin-dependent oxidoreductase [Dictyobacter aurantiacus]GCE10012.1 formate dehydrogenase [Dictyobacter aurantiacus]
MMKEQAQPMQYAPNGELMRVADLASCPPPERWNDWMEYDAKEWPRKVERHYELIPTICFNCEAACGLLAYIDKESGRVKKFEGNPYHPGSRGRNCAKGPATINQVHDPERILYPLKRVGKRGEGKWERTSWDEVLETLAAKIRAAIVDDRRDEVMYHVGRPGHDGYMERVLGAWGVDGHNSHTNVCSSSGRFGYHIWCGMDRPSPDHAHARLILLISSHLETGHYFNPQAQRIIEGKMKGAKLVVMDPRLSNTASMADSWLATWPGSEAAVLLAMVRIILVEQLYNREYMRRWVNWQAYMEAEYPDEPPTFEAFIAQLIKDYADYTPEFAAQESGVAAETIVDVARQIGQAGTAFAAHTWRAASAGNLGGWQVSRALWFLSVLTGSIGTPGGTAPHSWNKFVPAPFLKPAPTTVWNELLFPPEYPLANYEMSILLPYFLKEGRGKIAAYFTRVYNPVWTNPDGTAWIEALTNEQQIELHAALTPTWNETAWYADYVLPMGLAGERHDLMSQETHAARWIGFRQPVQRVYKQRHGEQIEYTYQANPGEVWEEDEFWIELSWRIDPDGRLGIRKYFESPYRAGEKLTIEEYYRWMFEHSVPGLPEAAVQEGLSPLAYMQKYGAFSIPAEAAPVFQVNEQEVPPDKLREAEIDAHTGIISRQGAPIGVMVDGVAREGFPTPSRKLEFYSATLKEWGWPDESIPGYTRSHVHPSQIDHTQGEYLLIPTFRLPTLIHTRSHNAKWLSEISNANPVWVHPVDAQRIGVQTGDLLRVTTDIGYYVNRAWVTEGIRPGVVACSHHMGRWRLETKPGVDRWASAQVALGRDEDGIWRMRQVEGVRPYASADPDSSRIFWRESGIHQNLTFPVHPDPVSGMHCWHQKVRVTAAQAGDRYGDIQVDPAKAYEVYQQWMAMARPQTQRPDGLRRPLWMLRPYRPANSAFLRDTKAAHDQR